MIDHPALERVRKAAEQLRASEARHAAARAELVERYLDLPYHIILVRDADASGPGWFARVEELDGCMTQADTLAELEPRLRAAMASWIETVLAEGGEVPLPQGWDAGPRRGDA
jgi:predicted RNase H-like HicB family nuclease